MRSDPINLKSLVFEARAILKKVWQHLHKWQAFVHDRFAASQTRYLITLSLIVGVVAGVTAYLFHKLVDFLSHLSVGDINTFANLSVSERALRALWPALGGLLVGFLMYFLRPSDRGQGVPEVIRSLLRLGGQMKPYPTFIKSLASAATIGSGGSAGPEGPIAEIGAATGSFLGRLLSVPPQIMRMLVAGGAAGGIAASFSAPIGGVFFALEVLIAEFTPQAFSLVVLSTVTATVVSRSLLGAHTYFSMPLYSIGPSWELIFFAILGIAAGLFSKVYVQFLDGMEQLFNSRKKIPSWLRPALGGLVVGALAILIPQILGSGHDAIEDALWGRLSASLMIALVFGKILATSITLGSGGVGGVFLPGFYVGAMMGSAYGLLIRGLFNQMGWVGVSSPGVYAVVGMAALLAASTRAPMTAVMILIEITNDYHIILPVMITSVLSTLISRSVESQTIYSRKLKSFGIQDREKTSLRPLETMMVEEVMSKNVVSISPGLSLDRLARLVETKGHSGFPVIDSHKKLVGLVTFEELRNALGVEDLPHDVIVAGDLMRVPPPLIFTDQPVGDALRLFTSLKVDRLIVVKRENPDKLLGIVTQADILSVYRKLLVEPV